MEVQGQIDFVKQQIQLAEAERDCVGQTPGGSDAGVHLGSLGHVPDGDRRGQRGARRPFCLNNRRTT